MRKWLFFAAASFTAIFAFVVYTLWANCFGMVLVEPIPHQILSNCSPFLTYVYLGLTFTSAALFLAFILLAETEKRKKHS